MAPQLILFDLDGTLVDTAPDLGGTVNRMRARRGLAVLDIAAYRPAVSHGAKGLLDFGLNLQEENPEYATALSEFLADYEANICRDSVLFPGVAELLDWIESTGKQWGVVTNKRTRFTLPLLAALQLDTRAASIVCADTTAAPKPSPLPMLHALSEAKGTAAQTLYVGDDERDVIAGKAASMQTAAITYGYHSPHSLPHTWGADYLFDSPSAIHEWLMSNK